MIQSSSTFTESEVEEAALEWLDGLGWEIAHGPDIAPNSPDAERTDYREVVLEQRLRQSLDRLNPSVPREALDDAFGRLTRPEGTSLESRNRAFHRMLSDGVNVEFRTEDGSVRGAQISAIDFDDPDNNDWLAVNQFTVEEGEHQRRPDIVLFVNGLPLGPHLAETLKERLGIASITPEIRELCVVRTATSVGEQGHQNMEAMLC